jgi:hypothetical protein
MSAQLISRSADLKRLRDEGYDVSIRASHLVVEHVPYVNTQKQVASGTLVTQLTLAGDIADKPNTHVAMFAGDSPCNQQGEPLTKVINSSGRRDLGDGLIIDHTFSSKPRPDGYADYHELITTYVRILGGPPSALDSTATARTFPVVLADDKDSIFNYLDTASSRAEIVAIAERLKIDRVAIIGLGGTGSYVLDFVAKTPVREIHLFDRDVFLQHNAFRGPGAPSIEQLQTKPEKVDYWSEQYTKMRRHIVAHTYEVDASNAGELANMDFAFVCIDKSTSKPAIIEALEKHGIPFIDVGMDIHQADGALYGILRITTSTPENREHVHAKHRISLTDAAGEDEYASNIQIAELNALNACLAVIKWKKLFGVYHDLEREHHSTYTIDGNQLSNADHRT